MNLELRALLKTIIYKYLTQRTYLPAGRRKEYATFAENIEVFRSALKAKGKYR